MGISPIGKKREQETSHQPNGTGGEKKGHLSKSAKEGENPRSKTA